jgi:KUP system potassium uptake protein
MHEQNNAGDFEILNDSRITRLPTIGIFYGDGDQVIPLIFRHYASSLMAIPSILIFISHKPLPVSYVPLKKQLSFRRIYLDQPAFHCDVNIGYLETRMDENCFEEIVVNGLIEFLQQHGEGEEEVACLYKAMENGDITHVTGEAEMIASQGSKLKKAILVSYNWMNRCFRQQRQIYQIPHRRHLSM